MPTNPQQLQSLLANMLNPNTEVVGQATQVLKAFLAKPICVAPMLQQIKEAPVLEARQMAAVLLRQTIGSHWKKLDDKLKSEIKSTLLQKLVSDEKRPVRNAVANLISAVGKKTVPKGEWNELLPFLLDCSKSAKVELREVSMLLFRALSENLPKALKPHLKTLQGIFVAALRDPVEDVRVEALQAIGALVEMVTVKNDVKGFSEVVPALAECLQLSMQNDDEEAASVAFEVFENLAEAPVPVLNQHIVLIVKLMLAACANSKLDINLRDKASSFLTAIVEATPKKLVKANQVGELLTVGINMCNEVCAEDFEHERMTPQKLGVELLDTAVKSLPKKLVHPLLLQHAIKLADSQIPNERKGGLIILAVMIEGAVDLIVDNLEPLVKLVCKATKDPETVVRVASGVALTQLADYLHPDEIVKYHTVIMPYLFTILDNPAEDAAVRRSACTALDVICENISHEAILPLVQQLVGSLMKLLNHPEQVVQATVVSALRSVCLTGKQAVAPFFKPLMQAMGSIVSSKADDKLMVRAKAMECIGALAVAAGPETFAPFLQDSMKMAIDGMNLEYYQLREHTFNFFELLAQAYGKKLNPLLKTIMTFVLAAIGSDDGVNVYDKASTTQDDMYEGFQSDSEDEEDAAKERRLGFSIRSGALDEKIGALNCLAGLIEHVGSDFLPYLDKTLSSLDQMDEYPHPSIRHSAINVYNAINALMLECFPNPEPVEPGKIGTLNPNAKVILDDTLPLLIARFIEDEDKSVCASALDGVAEVAKMFGMAAFQATMKRVCEGVMLLLNEKAECQVTGDEEEMDAAEQKEVAEHDEIVIDSLTDLITALATMCGAAFAPFFGKMLDTMPKFMQPERPRYNRSLVPGCLAEVAFEMKEAFAPFLAKAFPLVIAGMSDESVEVRRNSTYAAGVMCCVGQAATPYYQTVLAKLPALYNIPADPKTPQYNEFVATRDNACSVVAKMMLTVPAALPLDKVAPMFISGLPLTADYDETKYCYKAICVMFEAQPHLMIKFLNQVVDFLARTMGNPEVHPSDQQGLISLAKQLLEQAGEPVRAALENIPAQWKENFLKFATFVPPASQ